MLFLYFIIKCKKICSGSRSDKLEPLSELKAIGIEEYPRHVRWDKSEKLS